MSEVLHIMNSLKNGGLLGLDELMAFLTLLEYIKINTQVNAAEEQCQKVISFLQRNHLPSIRLEINGLGRFLPEILRRHLKIAHLNIAVLEMYSTENKPKRILEAFEVLLAARALNVHRAIWQTGFIEEMREWSYEGATHDDALDAVAGCLRSEPIRIASIGYDGTNFTSHKWQGGGKQFQAHSKFEVI